MPDSSSRPLIEGDAVILTGGGSTRMGADKALIRVDGVTLLERAVGLLAGIFTGVHLSIDPRRPYSWLQVPRIPDSRPDLGPLEGVRAALERIRRPALFAAVDLPGISRELALGLWSAGTMPGSRGAVPRWARGLEPALAVYTPSLLPEIGQLIRMGSRGLKALGGLPGVHILDLEVEEVRRSIFRCSPPPPAALFRNLNTPEDVSRFQSDFRCE